MVSCRICNKNIDNENASKHMAEHAEKGEIPHPVDKVITSNNDY
jgi:hypothetical protein